MKEIEMIETPGGLFLSQILFVFVCVSSVYFSLPLMSSLCVLLVLDFHFPTELMFKTVTCCSPSGCEQVATGSIQYHMQQRLSLCFSHTLKITSCL